MNIANFTDIYTNIYTYIIPSRPNPGRREKIKLSFIFTFLCGDSNRFYEGLKGLHKTF